ncbi:DNA polymerase III, delta subunit [Synechococcus sp. PCC 7502]|uniref:DNA polymerase III subunit delta n=1 Tax=Synechococcus sp. PCC 7502 TaxID=1173263 RepID=UPI00029FC7D3|nr:DNA polymerase III subunit delta [Synechococcus sp. PCC 7502]AFY74459.1 DNA polymerase III, delta subunit [Synechococcus sp. PCC 7502]
MTMYFFWGDDEYKITQTVKKLKLELIDPLWADFNELKVNAGSDLDMIAAFNHACTAPFGNGDRLTWLADTTIAQKCSDSLLAELERTLNYLPEQSHLVFTSSTKPDGRIKSTKLLQKYAKVQEFSLIPGWNTEAIAQLVKDIATSEGVNLTKDGIDFLVEAVGADSRRLVMELQKLKLLNDSSKPDASKPLNAKAIAQLVNQTAHNSFQLATAIRLGQVSQSLTLLTELLNNNEAGLRIAATLTTQFRTWLWVKVLQDAGERDDKAIATAAEISNPKRVYYFKQEVQHLKSQNLIKALSVLLQLEQGLKRGANETAVLQTAVIELCTLTKT